MKKKTRVKPSRRRTKTGKIIPVRGHIRTISVPSKYKEVKVLDDKTYEYCEDAQFFDEGRLIADDVVGPNATSTDDVEEAFEKKAGDKFEYLHAKKMKSDSKWKRATVAERKKWLTSVGYPSTHATKEWGDLPEEFKMVKKFKVYGVPEKDVPKPAGKCGKPCKSCKLY